MPEPRSKPQLVATDLDGTFLRSDGSVSPRSRRAVALAEDSGCTVVFASGRPPEWLHPVAEATDHHGLAIGGNGAVVYDLREERIVERFPIAPDIGTKALELIRDGIGDVVFAVQREEALYIEPGYKRSRFGGTVRELPVAEMWTEPAVKLLVRHETWDADTLLARTRELTGDLVEATHSNGEGLVEISAAGVSKATTLAIVCAERGISPDAVVAFGDMPNDLPMLAWAGTSYAVANAHPEVLAATDLRCPTNDEDGVARTLEQLFA